ncbi:serine/threonine-protein kinase 32B-like [Haliotis rufescens]|uniref:serine/threonine-protein kinase 32B-like n=1 Tax=Haliotis rufescens TaxID=6454 RepID=UPI00201EFB0B|nr:serine/threonine-protein kinase 32B-like [Haliotis rufescens]
MGTGHSARKESFDANGEVNFDHFQILRAIGKGSFGKVCIVQKKDTKKMFAMKYMNKNMCVRKDAILNVLREVEIMRTLDHPFLVNLWFTFEDEEDMFVVVDLLLGGDLRYHMQQEVDFTDTHVKLYLCEIALALDYLRSRNIVHRDIKPDNILLDEEGHAHITDFNIATTLATGELATSMSGTKPYMAPEVFACSLEESRGYGYPVDWWSMGVSAFELLKGRRPYEIHGSTTLTEVKALFHNTKVHYPSLCDNGMKDLLRQLLEVDPVQRLSTLAGFKRHPFMADTDLDSVLRKEVKPVFVPSKDHLNCDPTYELEEMIIETKPLHKKKKRLAKQNSRKGEMMSQSSTEEMDELQIYLKSIGKNFTPYNREKSLEEQERKKLADLESEKETTESDEPVKQTTVSDEPEKQTIEAETTEPS